MEAVRLVPGCEKWLLCIHTQPEGKERPQSFSMYPSPPVKSTRCPFTSS